MTKQEKQAASAGKRLAAALIAIEEYDGDPMDVLEEAKMWFRDLCNPQGVSDALKALREYYEGDE